MAKYFLDKDGKLTKKSKGKRYILGEDGNLTLDKSDVQNMTVTSSKEEEEDTWFKSGAFGDDEGNWFTDAIDTFNDTMMDVNTGILKGLGGMAEGLVDLGMYAVSGVSDLLGADKFAKDVKDIATKNAVKVADDKIKEVYNYEENSVLGNKSDNISQGLGQVAGLILTQGAGAAAGLGTGATTALTTGTTFLSSAGSGMSEAYQGGAEDKEAVTYGALKGGIDAGTELLFGGLGKGLNATGLSRGLGGLDDKLADFATKKITNQVLKNTVKYGIKASGEGLEEVLAGVGTAFAKQATYMSEEDIETLLNNENLLDQFITGSIVGGMASAPSLVKSNVSGRDYTTGLTANEQKVVDKEVDNRIAEMEADGTKLSNKEKSSVAEQVQKDLERGYISIDTIESTLGGDTYNSYQSAVDTESKLQEEIKTLEDMPNSQITVKQNERLQEARKELEALQKKDEKTSLRTKLNDEITSMTVKDTYLRESYNEKARRSQKYEADVSKYNEKQAAVIQKAIDSGILNNTNRTHEFVDMIAKISADKGVSFDFADNQKLKDSGFALDGKTVNGYVQGDNITINVNSAKAWNKVVGHEITHVLEGTELYTELQEMVIEYAKMKGEYQSRYDALANLYKDAENTNIDNELTADLVGDYLFTDEDFINNLSTEKPGIFKKIYNEIKYLLKVATAGSKEAKQLEKVKKTFDKVYKESIDTQSDSNTKYSLIGTDEDGIEVYETSDEVKKLSYSERNKLLLKSVLEDYKGRTAKFTKNGVTYYALYNEQGVRKGVYGDKKSDTNGRKAKTNIGADGNYIELAENALYAGTSNEQGKVTNSGFHTDAKTWDYYEKTIKSDGKYYDVLINVKDTGSEQYVYDITLKEASLPHRTNLYSRGKLAPNDIIPFSEENTSGVEQFSLSSDEDLTPIGSYNVYGKDLLYEALEEISGLKNDITELKDAIETANSNDSELATSQETNPDEQDVTEETVTEDITEETESTVIMDPEKREKEVERIKNKLERNKEKARMEFEEKQAKEREELGDKSSFIKEKARELYKELTNLKKGVKASPELGYLLDSCESWSELKKALGNISAKPDTMVNKNSATESIAREAIGRDYDERLEDIEAMTSDYNAQVERIETRAQEKLDLVTGKKKTRKLVQAEKVDAIRKAYESKGYDMDEVFDKAKDKAKITSKDNTPRRFMQKSLGYEAGEIFNSMTFDKLAENESKAIRWLNSFTDRKNGELAKLSKKYGIKPYSKEDAAAQMYAENLYVDRAGDHIEYGDAELAADFPDIDTQNRIKGLAKDPRVREIYDETLNMINESRIRNAYEEIPRRDNYFLHFRAMNDTFSRLGVPFNPDTIKANDLPTNLAGMTADLKPGQPFFASSKQRKGFRTTYSLLGGMERYLTASKNQIFHIDDIQNFRAMRQYLASKYGEGIDNTKLVNATEEEADNLIKNGYKQGKLHVMASFFDEEANIIAGKQVMIDRAVESFIDRKGLSIVSTIHSQVAKNMIAFNVSSALTNTIGAVHGLAKSEGKLLKMDALRAFAQTVQNKFHSDGFTEVNDAIVRRKGADKFHRTKFDKMTDAGFWLMGSIDSLTTEFLVRTKYNELTRKGMSSEQAHKEAGQWAMNILGDRSLGQTPQAFASKVVNMFFPFQLEVRNQVDSIFYDTIHEADMDTKEIEDMKERAIKKSNRILSTMVQLAVFQHIAGQAFEQVAGYNPTFDILSTLMTLLGFDDEEDSEDTIRDNAEQAFLELLEDLPYTSTLLGTGRIPIESALPLKQLATGKDDYGNDKSRWETLLEALPYYVSPGGWNQFKKSAQGMAMFDEDLPISGSYTDTGNLRYAVEDTPINRLQATIFGQWANENARDYIDNERQTLKSKQIEEFADLDMSMKEYWDYRDGLKEQSTLEEKFDYIAGLDASVEQKNIMINNVVDRKEKVDLSNYNDFSSYAEFDYAIKNPEKYKVSQAIGDFKNYSKYTEALSEIESDKDENGESISGSRKDKVIEYINNLDADYGSKILLYKMEYPGDDTYNMDIIDYLNSRDDISYQEMEDILKALEFTVEEDGTVRWD